MEISPPLAGADFTPMASAADAMQSDASAFEVAFIQQYRMMRLTSVRAGFRFASHLPAL
jgi:hypothetical protein